MQIIMVKLAYLATNSNTISLIDNTANQNGGVTPNNGYGIYLNGSANNILINNTASWNHGSKKGIAGNGGNGYGFYLTGSNNNTFRDNTANENTGGIGFTFPGDVSINGEVVNGGNGYRSISPARITIH